MSLRARSTIAVAGIATLIVTGPDSALAILLCVVVAEVIRLLILAQHPDTDR